MLFSVCGACPAYYSHLEVDVSIILDVVREKVSLRTDQQCISLRGLFESPSGKSRHLHKTYTSYQDFSLMQR